jgi:hypothetical protein
MDTQKVSKGSTAKAAGVMIEAGYKAFNGHKFTQAQADAYNRFTVEIDQERWEPTRDFLKDQRHRFFCVTIAAEGF